MGRRRYGAADGVGSLVGLQLATLARRILLLGSVRLPRLAHQAACTPVLGPSTLVVRHGASVAPEVVSACEPLEPHGGRRTTHRVSAGLRAVPAPHRRRT